MYDAATSKNAKMAEVIRGNEWCWPPTRSDQLVCIQGALRGSFAAAKEDNAIFTGSISGRFASVDPWNLVRGKKQRISWSQMCQNFLLSNGCLFIPDCKPGLSPKESNHDCPSTKPCC